MKAFIDADVLIWHLRGHAKGLKFLRGLRAAGSWELCIGAMQRAEIEFHMRPSEEAATRALLAEFETAPVDREVVELAGRFYRRWHPSHGIDANDALLAATAVLGGGRIFCLNHKHYPMPEVIAQRAWVGD